MPASGISLAPPLEDDYRPCESQLSSALAISGNDASIAPGVDRNTIFVAVWGDDRPTLGSNRLGRGLTPFEKR